jgi:hypothetical protein
MIPNKSNKSGGVMRAIKSLMIDTEIIGSSSYRGMDETMTQGNGMWMFGQGGPDLFFDFTGHNSSLKAYTNCPPLTAIINRKAQAFINGKTKILNSQGKEASSDLAKKIRKLMANPNPLQSGKQFEAQSYIYQQLFGYTIILPIKPNGFPNSEATSLWNIPPFMVDIKETDKLFYENPNGIIKSIVLTYKNQKTILNAEDLFIMKDFTPSFTSIVIPESRVKSLKLPINNIIGAYESRGTLINYRGAQGFLSPDKDPLGSIPLAPEDKEALQQDFRRYGLKANQWQIIISNSMLRWQQMGYPTKDLMLFEEIKDSTLAICDGYGYPPHLLGLIDPTFNNQSSAEKGLYQNSIIPESESIYEQWMSFFGAGENNLVICKDYDHITVIQEDALLAAQARFYRSRSAQMDFLCNVITLNQYRVIQDLPETADGNVYYSDIKAMIGTPNVSAGQIGEAMPGTTSTTNA